MPSLNFYVSSTEGRYGVRAPQDLLDGQTFGSQGATTCVILLLEKEDHNLFCGHMACGIQALPENKQTIKTKVAQLLDAALGDTNKDRVWTITGSSTDSANVWIREAIREWFTTLPAVTSNVDTDGYFINQNGHITSNLSTHMDENHAVEVDSGNFLIAH